MLAEAKGVQPVKGSTLARRFGAGIGIVAMAVGIGGVAGAANTHAHGSLPPGIGVLFIKTTGTVLPQGCTALPVTTAVVPFMGNAVRHANGNKTGAWFTETVTASAQLVTMATDTVLGTGHVTEWDGGALNQLSSPGKTTVVEHFTANFEGTLPTGAAIKIHGNGGITSHDATVSFTTTHTTTPIFTTPGRITRDNFKARCS